jgi:hypothetical protein
MSSPAQIATPIEIASLWRLNFLSGDDVSAVCLRWLEADLDGGDPDIASLAGAPQLSVHEVAPAFERVLATLIGRSIQRDEAILRALRLYLAYALEGDLLEGVHEVIWRFQDLSKKRLVHHPRRSADHPDEDYTVQELGLEYIYGCFYAFDDLNHLGANEHKAAKKKLGEDLRTAVQELETHLADNIAS